MPGETSVSAHCASTLRLTRCLATYACIAATATSLLLCVTSKLVYKPAQIIQQAYDWTEHPTTATAACWAQQRLAAKVWHAAPSAISARQQRGRQAAGCLLLFLAAPVTSHCCSCRWVQLSSAADTCVTRRCCCSQVPPACWPASGCTTCSAAASAPVASSRPLLTPLRP